jgi:hypothetical protein
MTSLLNDTFGEWTEGLDTRQSMISVFSHIRDIPYSLRVPTSNTDTSPEQVLLAGSGSCGPKHYLLAEMFRKLNLPVVYATIAFSWSNPDLHFPPELRKLSERLPIAYHLACRVQAGCRWILVDATWDCPLAKAGFPVNDHWDGYSEMKWAVKPLKSAVPFCPEPKNKPSGKECEGEISPADEKNHWNREDQTRYYHEKAVLHSLEEKMLMAQFFRDFERWLDDVRKR